MIAHPDCWYRNYGKGFVQGLGQGSFSGMLAGKPLPKRE